jgi:AcrR family transcriptional regulator
MKAARPRDKARQARTDLYRRLICEAAERVFAAHGFAGALVEEIAREADVSIGTLYRVFPGRKAEIYRAIQELRGTELIGSTRAVGLAAWQQRGDVLDAMLEGLRTLVEYVMAHPDYLRMTLHEEQAWALGPQRSTTEQTAMWKAGMEGAAEGMRYGVETGLLVDDDPDLMARTLVAMQQAHLGFWLEEGRQRSSEEVVAALQRQFLRAFCRPEVLAERGLSIAPSGTRAGRGQQDVRKSPRARTESSTK